METWESSSLDQMLINVFLRLKVVLCNILKGNGGNDLVEDTWGKKGQSIKIETILKELNDNSGGDTIDLRGLDTNDEQEEQGDVIQFNVEI